MLALSYCYLLVLKLCYIGWHRIDVIFAGIMLILYLLIIAIGSMVLLLRHVIWFVEY